MSYIYCYVLSPSKAVLKEQLYLSDDGLTRVDVRFEGDTVWLSLDQLALLFGRDKSTISRHLKNIFAEGELTKDSVVANFATTAADEKTYQVDYTRSAGEPDRSSCSGES